MTQQPGNASGAEANTQNAQISLMVFPYTANYYLIWQPTFHTAQSKSRTRHYFGCTTVNNAHSACYNWISPNTSKIR